jgi:Holliday junction resolvasome RuvABC endonuclease subunit
MNILALDPATKCGWAYGDATLPHSSWLSGWWDLSVRPDESTGMRLQRLQAKLRECHAWGLGLVVFEAGRNARNARAVAVAGQLQGVIELFCTNQELDYRGYSPAEIKKHATGKGNADKDAVANAAILRWPNTKFECWDQADALWLLDLAARDLALPAAALASEGLAERGAG